MRESSGKITLSDAAAPIYVATFEGNATDAEFEAYLAHLTKITNRPEVKALIFDARKNGATPPSQRKRMAEWMKDHNDLIRSRAAGCAFVLPSALQRGVLTAILWLQPMSCPHTIVSSLEEALAWAEAKLAARTSGKKTA